MSYDYLECPICKSKKVNEAVIDDKGISIFKSFGIWRIKYIARLCHECGNFANHNAIELICDSWSTWEKQGERISALDILVKQLRIKEGGVEALNLYHHSDEGVGC